jgi:hypothetical protein
MVAVAFTWLSRKAAFFSLDTRICSPHPHLQGLLLRVGHAHAQRCLALSYGLLDHRREAVWLTAAAAHLNCTPLGSFPLCVWISTLAHACLSKGWCWKERRQGRDRAPTNGHPERLTGRRQADEEEREREGTGAHRSRREEMIQRTFSEGEEKLKFVV